MTAKVVISIVDDDELVREATMSFMRALGFETEAFPSADDFLKSERRHSTSCLIADIQMPGMTGLELYRYLAGSDNPIPTILITAHIDECLRKAAVRADHRLPHQAVQGTGPHPVHQFRSRMRQAGEATAMIATRTNPACKQIRHGSPRSSSRHDRYGTSNLELVLSHSVNA